MGTVNRLAVALARGGVGRGRVRHCEGPGGG